MNVGEFKIVGGVNSLSVGGNGTGPKAVLGNIHDILISGATGQGVRVISPQGVVFFNIDVINSNRGWFLDSVQAITASTFIKCRGYICTNEAMLIHAADGISFKSCNFEACGSHGVSMEKQVGLAIAKVSFDNCWFEGNGTAGASNSIVSDDSDITGISIKDCTFNGLANGTRHVSLLAGTAGFSDNRLLGGDASFNTAIRLFGGGNEGTVVIPTNQDGFFEHNRVTYGETSNVRESITVQGFSAADRNDPVSTIDKGRLFLQDSTISLRSDNALDGEAIAKFDINGEGQVYRLSAIMLGLTQIGVGLTMVWLVL